MADEAIAIGQDQGPPRTSGWLELMTGTAQALAMMNRPVEAERALNHARDSFDALPREVTRDDSLLGFWEHSMYYTESYVYTYLGDYTKADRAQKAALQLYTPEEGRGPAKIELMRAQCLVRTGDISAGVAHAKRTIVQLAPTYRSRNVIDLGGR